MNIYEKMSAITAAIKTVAKNLEVGFGNSKYNAVSEADVLAAVKPLEEANKVYSYPVSRRIISSDIMTTSKTDSRGQVRETNQQFIRVETVYRFVNAEAPEEYIEIVSYGDGVDSQDKAPGKAMTYADKYALLKAYKIRTGEDPDQEASAEGRFKSKSNGGDFTPTCADCGAEITIPVHDWGVKKFGRPLCEPCYRRMKQENENG